MNIIGLKPIRIIACADLHAGHVASLTHPDSWSMPKNPPDYVRKFGLQRRRLWKWFREKLRDYGPYSFGIFLGDAIEGTGYRSGGVELLEVDRSRQCHMAATVLNFIPVSEWRLAFGTPYHCGEQEDWEQILANCHPKVHKEWALKCAKIESEIHLNVRGVQIAAKHYIGGGSSPASRFTSLSNAQIKQLLWAEQGQQPRANLILRAHCHRSQSVDEDGMRFEGHTLPALQGLGSRFGSRQMDGLPVHFGFKVIHIKDRHQWHVEKAICPLRLQAAEVTYIP